MMDMWKVLPISSGSPLPEGLQGPGTPMYSAPWYRTTASSVRAAWRVLQCCLIFLVSGPVFLLRTIEAEEQVQAYHCLIIYHPANRLSVGGRTISYVKPLLLSPLPPLPRVPFGIVQYHPLPNSELHLIGSFGPFMLNVKLTFLG